MILAVAWGSVALWSAVILVAALFFLFLAPNLFVTYFMYVIHLKRTRPDKWSRECSEPQNPVQAQMYAEGLAWSDAYASCRRDVHIVNEGLNLYGEFYDQGSDRTAILVSGRTEGLRYCYYFAKPYADAGYNVLTIDPRAHGLSDGKYNTVGFEEHKDLMAWMRFLRDECHTESVVLHGICIGAACCLYTAVSPDCPPMIAGITGEGVYPTFYDSFRNHMIELKKPLWPGLPMIDGWKKLFTGHSMKVGPIHIIDRLSVPLLMIHSKEDLYSLPSAAQEIFDRCGSAQKTLVWFEHGKHSQLRYTDRERYDGAVTAFLESLEKQPVPADGTHKEVSL